MSDADRAARIAIDIGGTFTDVVYRGSDGVVRHDKLLSTPADITDGIVAALERVGARLPEVRLFLHGTTVALNALLEGRIPPLGLVTTAGFRDVLEIMRTNRPDMYNLRQRKPEPLVARRFRREISARTDFSGAETAPVDREEVTAIAADFVAAGISDVAVCLLHSYADPEHEHRVKQLLREAQPSLRVTISSDLSREWREFERTSTTVINAATAPIMSAYLQRLQERLTERGFAGRLLIMQSSGGVMAATGAMTRPAATLMSGPVGGVAGALAVARSLGEHASAVTLDIGGTSADVAAIDRGRAIQASGSTLAGWPILMPSVQIESIGAGGGSLAFVDRQGGLHVGPESAGSDPGPACYGSGGQRATVTDANLVLGRIDGSRFLDGRFPLDLAAARAAIKRDVADPLGFSVERAALGVLTVVNSNMARLLRDVLVQRGYDPRVFALLAFGGGGPLHACSVGSEAGLPRVVIPCHPSTFSAFGIFAADMRNDQESMFVRPAFGVNDDELAAAYRELEDSARGALTGDENDAVDLTHAAGLRYAGQEYMIDVERRRSSKVSDYVTGFHAEHARLYGFERSDVPVEFVKLSVCGVVKMEDPRDAPDDRYTGPPSGETRRREVWSSHGLAEVPVLERADLLPGVHLVGPSVIEEPGATTYIADGWTGIVDRHRNLILDRVAASLSLANDTRASTVA